ncbi:Transposase [Hexamita inflata]|uniref:Tc1-like n=1 Tax=Hexamita inflata TaxID=28002 RepID=A0AA86QT11_9EUKA|nr:Tc1-like [Hexamita inflata]
MTIYNLGWHHPHLTLSQISQQIFEQCQVKLTRPTISYTLAECGYKFYKQTVIQALTEERKKKRLAFANCIKTLLKLTELKQCSPTSLCSDKRQMESIIFLGDQMRGTRRNLLINVSRLAGNLQWCMEQYLVPTRRHCIFKSTKDVSKLLITWRL